MTKGPMQGAAMIPINRPMISAPSIPLRPPEACMAHEGGRISQAPNMDAAKARRTSTIDTDHNGVLQGAAEDGPTQSGKHSEHRIGQCDSDEICEGEPERSHSVPSSAAKKSRW